MTDRREAILARLAALGGGIANVKTALRNKLNPDDAELPAVIVFDGDEEGSDADPENRPTNAPRRIALTPDIRILLGSVPEDVGTDLNTIRAAFVKAVLTDATLTGLVLDRIGIRYLGCSTDLHSARAIEGNMWVHFKFTYALRPDEL